MPHPTQLLIGAFALLAVGFFAVSVSHGEVHTIDASATPPAPTPIALGATKAPGGQEISINSVSFMKNGKPWLPVMGEFHYSRYPASEWRDELLKMKAGGINIVATYVFWIHHEEEKDKWDWTGDRNLRDFIKACADTGMPVVVRMGPWCHGEVRNGGIPEWAVPMGRRLRTEDPEFMERTKILYTQIAEQIRGMLWKDGGPVVGVQFDNEYRGRAEYLLALKKIGTGLGIDTPIYTRTGWPALSSPMPAGEIVPLYGAYAEGFWDRGITAMPGKYWFAFVFSNIRSDDSIGTDVLGERAQPRDETEARNYPFLSCELGGGMMNSYHRRILIDPRDVESVALVKTGSGGNMPGYYMYHGGTNPEGKLTTLMEAQNTPMTNYNDMPVKNYDFQAPLGQYGQLRPHYHGLRKLHLMLNDWGEQMATMPAYFAPGEQRKNDTERLRWSVRSDGKSGFVFVSNYQRLLPMPAKKDVQFDIKLSGGSMKFPAEPVTVPADSYFVWPFNLDLGGAKLAYATAQPICKIEQDGTLFVFFGQSGDVPPEFAFDAASTKFEYTNGFIAPGDPLRIVQAKPALEPSIKVKSASGKSVHIFLLDPATSLQLWKGNLGGKETVALSHAGLIFDGDKLRVQALDNEDSTVRTLKGGVLTATGPSAAPLPPLIPTIEQIKPAGPVRQIKNGVQRAAEAPSDADFEQAAIYRIKVPAGIDANRDLLLRIQYAGDVARLYVDGKFISDDYYNGREMDLALKRLGSEPDKKEILLKIIPLQKGAPIYLAKEAIPDFGDINSVVKVASVRLIDRIESHVAPN